MLDEISKCSAPGPGVTRLPFTREHRAALDLLSEWMRSAGLEVSIDSAGSLIGRLEGPRDSRTFLLGSHQDSVREGGAYDGIMGVVLPILAMEKLRNDGISLPYSVEILAFADEEGVRFPTALMGPRAIAGSLDPYVLDMTDISGSSLRKALEEFGLSPNDLTGLQRDPEHVLGYLETHIEQGPVLEDEGEAVGVVSAICGIERHHIIATGETGHAGTLPMQGRRDALVGAATIISKVHQLGMDVSDLRATVGELHVEPNVVNAVPRSVRMSVEFRSPDDDTRRRARAEMRSFLNDLASRSGLIMEFERTYEQGAQPCAVDLSNILRDAIQDSGARGLTLPSGATHDASAMADLCPIAMLFVRCRNGVSHTPDEFASSDDMSVAIRVIARFLAALNA